jgi:hypothetical protein
MPLVVGCSANTVEIHDIEKEKGGWDESISNDTQQRPGSGGSKEN